MLSSIFQGFHYASLKEGLVKENDSRSFTNCNLLKLFLFSKGTALQHDWLKERTRRRKTCRWMHFQKKLAFYILSKLKLNRRYIINKSWPFIFPLQDQDWELEEIPQPAENAKNWKSSCCHLGVQRGRKVEKMSKSGHLEMSRSTSLVRFCRVWCLFYFAGHQ